MTPVMLPFLLATVSAQAEDLPMPQPGSAHYDLEVLYHDHEYEDGLAEAKKEVADHPDDTDLYWHIVRFMFEIGERYGRDDKGVDKVAWYEEMVDWSKKGLAKKPGDPHLLFALGISEGRLGTTRGVLSSLFLAQTVEQSWLASANSDLKYSSLGGEEMLPCHVYESLGIYYRLVPESWIVQAIAGTRGDIQKSIDWNRKADQCAPNSVAILKELGASLVCYGQRHKDADAVQEGLSKWSFAAALPAKLPTDDTDHAHLVMLLRDPSLACGYSRDGEQDVDDAHIDKDVAAGKSAK